MEKAKVVDVDDIESDDIPHCFTCCVCLELLYKPIVLPCGHMACFWCVNRSMNSLNESYCPTCRNKYGYFPGICQMLHFLLLKMYPVLYRRREEQVLEEEKKTGLVSLQPDYDSFRSQFGQEYDHQRDVLEPSSADLDTTLFLGNASTEGGESSSSMEHDSRQTQMGNADGQQFPQNLHIGNCHQVSVSDVLCLACKQLLYRPVVLNCGHVYCATCTKLLKDEVLRCQACQNRHSSGFPKVCLAFDHFLEEKFPVEYAMRREVLQNREHLEHEKLTCSAGTTKKGSESSRWKHLPWQGNPGLKVHVGVGCDSCGIFPIIGERYKCQDCSQEMSFDLCGDCYNMGSKHPARFNMQHTPEHKYKRDDSRTAEKYFTFLRSEQSGIPVFLSDAEQGVAEELLEDETPASGFSNDDNDEHHEDGLAAPATRTDSSEHRQENPRRLDN